MISFLSRFFEKRHSLPDPGADGATLQLFQEFPKFALQGVGTVNQQQFAVTTFSTPITLGVHVVVPKVAPVGGIGGVQNGGLTTTPLYNTQTGVTGRNGI